MNLRVGLALAALALAGPAGAAGPTFRATFKAPTHTPKVDANWRYEVRATDLHGKPIRATLTAQILDPFGGVHPVEFDCCLGKNIVNHPFTGVFRDKAEFPAASRGFKLTFRVTVKARGRTIVLTYWVRAV